MKKMATAFAAALMLGLMLATTACSGTVQDRQASADQVFGDAKMGLVVTSGLVGSTTSCRCAAPRACRRRSATASPWRRY